jgi:hypothetical protein
MELLAYEDPDFALTEALETDPIVMRELVERHLWALPARKGSCCSCRTPRKQRQCRLKWPSGSGRRPMSVTDEFGSKRGLSICGRGCTMTNRIRRTSFAQRG